MLSPFLACADDWIYAGLKHTKKYNEKIIHVM